MGERYDAIIIGAGIIGAATAFELCKRGWKTLNVDFLPAAGYGSTSNSCAIIRVHYSIWKAPPSPMKATTTGEIGPTISKRKTSEAIPSFTRPAPW